MGSYAYVCVTIMRKSLENVLSFEGSLASNSLRTPDLVYVMSKSSRGHQRQTFSHPKGTEDELHMT